MRAIRLLFILALFLASLSHTAQSDSTLRLNESDWKELTSGVEFNENYKEKEKKQESKSNSSPKSHTPGTDLSGMKYVFYFLAVGAIIALIIWVFWNYKPNTTVNNDNNTITAETIQKAEENIHEANLEGLLQQALANKNYRIALRLNFLILIRSLSQKEKIFWAKEKTNWEYYSELKDRLMADQFKAIVNTFEVYWYGDRVLTESGYLATEPLFQSIHSQLNRA